MAGALRITALSSADDAEYTEFLDDVGRSRTSVLAYHYPFYRDLLTRIGVGEPCYLAARCDSRIVGVLPGFTKSTRVGTVYSSLPYFGPNAGVMGRSELDQLEEQEVHEGLLKGALDRLSRASRPIAASFYTPVGFDSYLHYEQALPERFVTVEKFTQYQKPSEYEPKRKLRYDLRKAEGQGVRVIRNPAPELMDEFYTVYAENCRRRAIPLKPREAIDALSTLASARGHVGTYLALREGRTVAGCMVLRAPNTISVYMIATRECDRALQPASLAVDQALRDAADQGIRCWNWEASPAREDGVYRFKKKWGAMESGYRIYVVPFQPPELFQTLGARGIREQWPHFFVYPFSTLERARGTR